MPTVRADTLPRLVGAAIGAWALMYAIAGTALHGASKAPLPDRPNVVIIFIDDMGYGDVGPFGSILTGRCRNGL